MSEAEPSLDNMLVIDLAKEKDVITYCPLETTALWGPTEEKIGSLSEGIVLNKKDISWLSDKYFECTGRRIFRENIVSYRVGIRPLCVPVGYDREEYTLNISRNAQIFHSPSVNLTTIYGGKFTGSEEIAHAMCRKLKVSRPNIPLATSKTKNAKLNFRWEGNSVVDPEWSLENEMSWFLSDYLRRRTTIHQSCFNGGFGLSFENTDAIRDIAEKLFPGELQSQNLDFEKYLSSQKAIDNLLRGAISE